MSNKLTHRPMNFCPRLKHSEDLTFISIGTTETFFLISLYLYLLNQSVCLVDSVPYLCVYEDISATAGTPSAAQGKVRGAMPGGPAPLLRCSACSSSTSLEDSFLCFQFHPTRAPNSDWKLLEISLLLAGRQVCQATTLQRPKPAWVFSRAAWEKVSVQSTRGAAVKDAGINTALLVLSWR